MNIYIEQNQPFSAPIRWVFDLIAANKQAVFEYVITSENADFVVSKSVNSDVCLDLDFYRKIDTQDFDLNIDSSLTKILNFSEIDAETNAKTDFFAPIFYLTNCLQEYGSTSLDNHQRYQFSASWQAQAGLIAENVVQRIINLFLENQAKFSHLAVKSRKSAVFLTHDIDGLFNAWKTEGVWAAKSFRLDKLLHLLFLEAVRRPAWFNIDDILKLHSAYDVRSTFFFLTEKGWFLPKNEENTEGVFHADYDVNTPKIQQLFTRIKAQKSEIGLHKSAFDSSDFPSELNKLPMDKIRSNRYHFLKFQLPKAWQTMERAGVQLDASLGFAEQFGFRNSYGLPFSPYDFEKKRAMNLVVTPLNIMDGTMEHYMKMPESEIAKTILSFLDNNRNDAILSLLWHNREFAPFRFEAYLEIYKQVLTYLHETKMPTVTASEIVEMFKV
jgi:hypothetical protein